MDANVCVYKPKNVMEASYVGDQKQKQNKNANISLLIDW